MDLELDYYCAAVLREHWLPFPCPEPAVQVFVTEDAIRVAWCQRHAEAGRRQAAERGWVREEVGEPT